MRFCKWIKAEVSVCEREKERARERSVSKICIRYSVCVGGGGKIVCMCALERGSER
jgi:hypothetical protein